jgi:hypothetical protein
MILFVEVKWPIKPQIMDTLLLIRTCNGYHRTLLIDFKSMGLVLPHGSCVLSHLCWTFGGIKMMVLSCMK